MLLGITRDWHSLWLSLASVPYVQIKWWDFRSVSLVMSGTTQSFWSCSQAYFCQLRDAVWIPNSKENFAGSVHCQFCQTWQVLLWEIYYLLGSILKLFLSILFLSTMILLEKIIYKNEHLFFGRGGFRNCEVSKSFFLTYIFPFLIGERSCLLNPDSVTIY